MKRATRLGYAREKRAGMLMLAPFLILFFIFTVLPILSSVVLSFFTYDMISAPSFYGIGNYIKMLTGDDMFPKTLRNTLLFAIVTGPLGYLLSFGLAWMINELNRFLRTALSFLFYAPALAGNVYLIWQVLFSGDSYGYINSLLLSLGLITEPVQWLKSAVYTMPVVMLVQLWMSMGVSFLANIAGLQNVNPELYEAGWHRRHTQPLGRIVVYYAAVYEIHSFIWCGDANSVGVFHWSRRHTAGRVPERQLFHRYTGNASDGRGHQSVRAGLCFCTVCVPVCTDGLDTYGDRQTDFVNR